MNVRTEVLRIINKVLGKTSFLDLCFFDTQIIANIKQIDYLRKKYELNISPLEFINLKSTGELYDMIKRYSPDFRTSAKDFSDDIYSKYSNEILRNYTFSDDEIAEILSKLKTSGGILNMPIDIKKFDKSSAFTYSRLFSEIIKLIKAENAHVKLKDSEVASALYVAIYECQAEQILNKGLAVLNLSRQGKDAVRFIVELEKLFKIKVPLEEIGKVDIFTCTYKWLQKQRPDLNASKTFIENEIIALAARVFNDSNLVLNLVNKIEDKYKINISKEDLLNSGGFNGFVQTVTRSIKEQKNGEKVEAGDDVSIEIMSLAADFMAKKFEFKKPKLDKMNNPEMIMELVEGFEKKYKLTIPRAELRSTGGFNGFVGLITRCINEQRPDLSLKDSDAYLSVMALASDILPKQFGVEKPENMTTEDENKFITALEDTFKITFSVFDLMELTGLESIIKTVEKLVKKQKAAEKYPELFPKKDLAHFIRSQVLKISRDSKIIKTSGAAESSNNIDMSGVENKFITDIENRFKVSFDLNDLMSLTGLDSVVEKVAALIKQQQVLEAYPGIIPPKDSLKFIRTEVLKISRDNMTPGSGMMTTDMGGIDFPKKLDSMLAIEVVVQLEKNFKIKIPEEKLYAIKTQDELVSLVEGLIEEKNKESKPAPDLKDKL
ncbi:MAG: acyl carrier protein [Candidatus Wallbacteria bacterium]